MAIDWRNYRIITRNGKLYLAHLDRIKRTGTEVYGSKSPDFTKEILYAVATMLRNKMRRKDNGTENGERRVKRHYYGYKLEDGSKLLYIDKGYNFYLTPVPDSEMKKQNREDRKAAKAEQRKNTKLWNKINS